ncbi:MAG TPA: RHS repeat-associated core domain-containing protein, partial [Pirellulaceae bacterium]|nr:RHS repeat-associated core domain-containing protein [Pirellulaceae bacterium]
TTSIPAISISSSAKQSLTWDFDNQLVGVDLDEDDVADVTYEYDVLKRRVARTPALGTGQVYVYAGEQIVADYERGAVPASTPTYRYVWGIYIDEPILRQASDGEILYYHRNQQYSTTALTNNSGLVVERYAYTAYGQVKVMTHTAGVKSWTDNSNRFLYTGREWDNDTQLYHFRARQYSPHLGRFTSRDTLGYVDGMSLYAGYFAVRGIDPFGYQQRYAPGYGAPIDYGSKTPDLSSIRKKFLDWLIDELHRGPNWYQNLQPCPCNIRCVQWLNTAPNIYVKHTRICNPDPEEWDLASIYNPFSGFTVAQLYGNYHPGGVYELRTKGSRAINGSGQQCIYYSNGDLAISIPTAGSADLVSPTVDFLGHQNADVIPFEHAQQLGDWAIEAYFLVRPANANKPCSERPEPQIPSAARREYCMGRDDQLIAMCILECGDPRYSKQEFDACVDDCVDHFGLLGKKHDR